MAAEVLVERLRSALELADTGVSLMRQNLRRAHPDASADEVEDMLRDWINRRPGAELGDCPGSIRVLTGL